MRPQEERDGIGRKRSAMRQGDRIFGYWIYFVWRISSSLYFWRIPFRLLLTRISLLLFARSSSSCFCGILLFFSDSWRETTQTKVVKESFIYFSLIPCQKKAKICLHCTLHNLFLHWRISSFPFFFSGFSFSAPWRIFLELISLSLSGRDREGGPRRLPGVLHRPRDGLRGRKPVLKTSWVSFFTQLSPVKSQPRPYTRRLKNRPDRPSFKRLGS